MIIKPRVKGFICITSHPEGCAANVASQIEHVKSKGKIENGPKNVLVVGASQGYGLASRISAAFGSGANTLGVFFEKPSERGRCATAGWYNSVAFEKAAKAEGLFAKSLNGDAFSHELKAQAIEIIKNEMGGKIDLLVYSIGSPRRTDPDTGETYKSAIRPIGKAFSNKYLDTDKKVIDFATLEPGTDEEIEGTVKVMGGQDWEIWFNQLSEAGVLADGFKTVAYDYIGPTFTWPIYKDGALGQAKLDVRRAKDAINEKLAPIGGQAFVSVNKALVTQSSSAIPGVNLYITVLYKVMKEAGTHEGCIEQMQRLFATQLYKDGGPTLDELGLIRMDDWEMKPEIQDKIAAIWPKVETETIDQYTDFAGYQIEFLKLFGFHQPGVDYEADTNPEVDFA
ncbi:MAG: enoyl-ACP reductase FabV [Verrucomicrobiota bacterium]